VIYDPSNKALSRGASRGVSRIRSRGTGLTFPARGLSSLDPEPFLESRERRVTAAMETKGITRDTSPFADRRRFARTRFALIRRRSAGIRFAASAGTMAHRGKSERSCSSLVMEQRKAAVATRRGEGSEGAAAGSDRAASTFVGKGSVP